MEKIYVEKGRDGRPISRHKNGKIILIDKKMSRIFYQLSGWYYAELVEKEKFDIATSLFEKNVFFDEDKKVFIEEMKDVFSGKVLKKEAPTEKNVILGDSKVVFRYTTGSITEGTYCASDEVVLNCKTTSNQGKYSEILGIIQKYPEIKECKAFKTLKVLVQEDNVLNKYIKEVRKGIMNAPMRVALIERKLETLKIKLKEKEEILRFLEKEASVEIPGKSCIEVRYNSEGIELVEYAWEYGNITKHYSVESSLLGESCSNSYDEHSRGYRWEEVRREFSQCPAFDEIRKVGQKVDKLEKEINQLQKELEEEEKGFSFSAFSSPTKYKLSRLVREKADELYNLELIKEVENGKFK
jgi:hypothetical protein